MAAQDDSDGEGLSWAESLAAIVNCGMGVAFSGSDATESGGRIPPVPPPAEEDDTASMVDNLLRCGGSEAGQTYDEVVTSPQKPTDPAIPVEALYDEILSLREQVARMEAGGAFALQDELDRLRRRLDTADGDLGAPLPPPEDAPLEYEEIGGRDSAPTLSAADRESAAARLSRGGPRQRTASRVPRE